jgi:hypothetical protein
MSSATRPRESLASFLARCSVAEKAELLATLARQLFDQQPDAKSISIADNGGLVGYLTKPAAALDGYDPQRDDPEFYAEILRRVRNPEALLTKQEVKEMLGCADSDLGDDLDDVVERRPGNETT